MLFALVEALLRYLACMACLAAAMLFGSWTYKSASVIAASGRLHDWFYPVLLVAVTTAFFGGACYAIIPPSQRRQRQSPEPPQDKVASGE